MITPHPSTGDQITDQTLFGSPVIAINDPGSELYQI